MDCYGRDPTAEEFQFLQDRLGFSPEHGVMIPAKGVSIYDRPQEKVGVPIHLFETGLRLAISNFFNMILDHYRLSVDELTSSAINKIIGFRTDLSISGYRRTRDFSNRRPKLFGSNLTLGKRLGNMTIIVKNWEDFILAAVLKPIIVWKWPCVVTIREEVVPYSEEAKFARGDVIG
ncbi:unnamed protein product [Lactuca saligna]|uniref:Uncharacterized protein n=1 Tax=Lactuca saligna TaxID=75948 RepID=A0AA35YQ98_LACSI|nr:unnamed protein product [Lactuca saligna]